MENKTKEYYTIDFVQIAKALKQKIWLIIVCGVLAAVVGFSLSAFVITPTYSSSIMLYVNNSSFTLGNSNFSISSSEITAAQSLVKTYREILNNKTTLERIIEKTRVDYTYKELSRMIEATSSNGTEIMKVTVTTENPYVSAKIANGIAEVLPVRVAEIIDGASMEVVDSAIPVFDRVAPSILKYTAIGLMCGVLAAVALVTILAISDDTIHDEEYILQNYEYPILAKIPNLLSTGNKRYGYYYYQNENKTQQD